MRNRHTAPDGVGGGVTTAGYPGPRRRHPIFMFGTFPPMLPAGRQARVADDALLCIREDAATAEVGVHLHHHADLRARDRHRFMFGVAPEQCPTRLPAEPVYYFWDADGG